MCEICKQIPCVAQCPNTGEPARVVRCAECRDWIMAGENMYHLREAKPWISPRENYYCTRCIDKAMMLAGEE